jgi:hypothetical protein
MREIPNALQILLDEQKTKWPSIPPELVEDIYRIEERVQFDEERLDAPRKIKLALKSVLDKEYLYGDAV